VEVAHNPENKAFVRRSYVFDKLPLTQSCAIHGVAIGTARRWKKKATQDGDCWDKARASNSMTTGNMDEMLSSMVNDFVTMHKTLCDEITNNKDMDALTKINALASLADSLNKCIAAAGRASPRLNRLSLAIEIIETLGHFIQEKFPEHALAFAEVIEPFGVKVSKKYG